MAEARDAESAATPKKKKKLMLFIIIGILVLAIAGAGGTWFMLKKKKAASEDGDDEPSKDEVKKSRKATLDTAPPVFIKLEPFTVKLQSEGQESYLQTTPELRVLDAKMGELIKAYMPEIRHKVLLILSGKKSSDLTNPQGVERLSGEMRMTINTVLDPSFSVKKKKKPKANAAAGSVPGAVDEGPAPIPEAEADDPVQAVLFTSFIVQ